MRDLTDASVKRLMPAAPAAVKIRRYLVCLSDHNWQYFKDGLMMPRCGRTVARCCEDSGSGRECAMVGQHEAVVCG